eukprot:406506_1
MAMLRHVSEENIGLEQGDEIKVEAKGSLNLSSPSLQPRSSSIIISLKNVIDFNLEEELNISQTDMIAKRKQFQHKILSLMKACYLTAYEE